MTQLASAGPWLRHFSKYGRIAAELAGRGLALFAEVSDSERRDGPSECVIRGKDAVVAMPVLLWRWDQIREPVEELIRREFDHAIGSRPRGLPPASRADPVGRLVSREHVVDSSDAAICTTPDGEPLQREGRTGTVSQTTSRWCISRRSREIDARPSDAIAMGVTCEPNLPIYVAEEVIESILG
jgi:hypothetical protein